MAVLFAIKLKIELMLIIVRPYDNHKPCMTDIKWPFALNDSKK